MNIKLITTDLDNTLLRHDKTISDYTVDVFKRCRERGILLVFATSRSEFASARFTARIAPDIFISNGGALTQRGEEVLYRVTMTSDLANTLISKMQQYPEIDWYTVESENGYFNSMPIDVTMAGWVDYSHSQHTDFSTAIDFGEVFKITVASTSAEPIHRIYANYPEFEVINFTGEDWYQIKSHKASKEAAIRAVAEKLNISLSDIAAFGDDHNDVDMLRAVGYGVAVANAIPEAKAAARYECGECDEDVVARWVEENVL
ncbi:haloacid dehalogenase [Clostridia bacterium]|nr:haloacid dehalogenase [Clostridia bacterium]